MQCLFLCRFFLGLLFFHFVLAVASLLGCSAVKGIEYGLLFGFQIEGNGESLFGDVVEQQALCHYSLLGIGEAVGESAPDIFILRLDEFCECEEPFENLLQFVAEIDGTSFDALHERLFVKFLLFGFLNEHGPFQCYDGKLVLEVLDGRLMLVGERRMAACEMLNKQSR